MPSPHASAVPDDARAEYDRRLTDRRRRRDHALGWDRRLADVRLLLFVAGLVLCWLVFGRVGLWWGWLAVLGAAFAALLVAHERVRRAAHRAERAVEFYEKNLRRIDGTWPGTGVAGERFHDDEHLYAADLDLFGVGSLFERLCTARTRAGEEALAAWLKAPAEPPTIRERQEAVAELRPRLDLREDLHLLGADVREGIDPDALVAWGREPRVFPGPVVRVVASLLGAVGVGAVGLMFVSELGYVMLLLTFLLDIGFLFLVRPRYRRVLGTIGRRTHDLRLLAELLHRLEQERFVAPALTRLREALETDHVPASRCIGRLAGLSNLLDAKDNQLFAPVALLLQWVPHLAVSIDAWRGRHGPEIAGWLAAVGEFEALCSIAAYAYENPSDPFPEIADGEVFDGEAVGHPLIREPICIRNDVSLGGERRVLLVSGSNMSGKSTLLRTVGANTVLALAGAPVHARRLRVSVFAIGATLRIQDSLQAGKSRFYAEITRVRRIVDLSRGTRPLLFLLDEIFHGTNSHDRAVGAEAIVLGLIERGAVGLVTTHDLALAEFADRLAPRATNVHFEDQLIDGHMRFDYRMRPGVVRHSNALALMRAVGLDV